MCFVKSSAPVVEQQEPVVRKEADASLTKNSNKKLASSGFAQNIKTSAFGLEDEAKVSKKTLLGE